jgi:hypothetical protein
MKKLKVDETSVMLALIQASAVEKLKNLNSKIVILLVALYGF